MPTFRTRTLALSAAGVAEILGLVGFVSLAPQPAHAGNANPPRVDLPFEQYKLKNGLDVTLRRDPRVPLVAVNLWYHVGPANEEAGRTGFAHLFEHMMFQNSLHVGEDQYFPLLEGAGASIVNGSTDFDRTNYLEDVPPNQLELALWMESDRMGFLPETITAVSLANQQDVVRNERRQGSENPPGALAQEALWHNLFPKGHPYYALVIGSHEDIQAAKLDDVKAFFRRYYCPNNASLAIVGDIDVAKTKEWVEKYFGSLPRGEEVPPIRATTPPITAERRVEMTDTVELPKLSIAWLTTPIYQPGDAEAIVAARILAGGKASRLYKSLVYEKQIAQDVSAYQQSADLTSIFGIDCTAKPGHDAKELEAAIDAELARLAKDGPTEEELTAARNGIWADEIASLEQIGSFGGVADRLNKYSHYFGDAGHLNDDLARYAKVTREEVRDFAATQLAKNKRVVVACLPGEKVLPPDPPAPPAPTETAEAISKDDPSRQPWRNVKPTAGPMTATPLPSATRFTLDNGLSVYHVRSGALPVVAAQLVVRAGSAEDPAQRFGLAGFTSDLLDEGTKTRDALTLATDLEALGASLHTGVGTEGTYVTCRSLRQNFPSALGILADAALAPAFPAEEVERVRSKRQAAMLEQQASPFQAAQRVLASCVYGDAHPYGHLPMGTEESLAAISRDDAVNFYRANFAPNNAALILVGDLTEDDARRLANESFGKWSGRAKPTVVPPAPQPINQRLVIVDKPGSPQTALLVAQPAVRRSDPDFDRLSVMNAVLGGNFAGRLNMNLREDKGYTYGSYSWLGEERGVSTLGCWASVRTDVTGAAIGEILKEYAGMSTRPPSAEELDLAKESLTQTLPAKFQTSDDLVGTIGQLYLLELEPDYYQSLPQRLGSMTGSDVTAIARKYVDSTRLIVIAVGDREKIEAQIGELRLGSVAYRAADGKQLDVN